MRSSTAQHSRAWGSPSHLLLQRRHPVILTTTLLCLLPALPLRAPLRLSAIPAGITSRPLTGVHGFAGSLCCHWCWCCCFRRAEPRGSPPRGDGGGGGVKEGRVGGGGLVAEDVMAQHAAQGVGQD